MSGNSVIKERSVSPEIKVDREVVLTINHQEFRIRKGERFVAGEGKLVIKPAKGDEVNEEDSVDQDKNSGNQSQRHSSGATELSLFLTQES